MVSSHFGELVRKQKEDKLRKMNPGVWLVVNKLMLLGIWSIQEIMVHITCVKLASFELVHKIVNIFLSVSLNICFGCSKEPSHGDGSFEYPQQMFSLIWFDLILYIP